MPDEVHEALMHMHGATDEQVGAFFDVTPDRVREVAAEQRRRNQQLLDELGLVCVVRDGVVRYERRAEA